MKLTILIITFNQEKYIAECLESVINQKTPVETEIIVCDDCSSDRTVLKAYNILKQASCSYKILKNDQNIGISKNYQIGFRECKGEFIAVIEGDDYWTDPDRLIKHITFLESHKECVMSFNRFVYYYEDLKRFVTPEWNNDENFEYITSSQMAGGNCIGNLSACVFRNSEIRKLNQDFFSMEIADWILGMALGQFGLIGYLKDTMSVYRINPNGQWSKMSLIQQNRTIIRLIDIYNEYLRFKFNREFTLYKRRLLNSINEQPLKHPNFEFVPPAFVSLFRRLIPVRLRRFIKKLI
jgi:glycosyltransferase involved in cell wall biosynthesis